MADTLVKKPKLIVGTQSQVEAEMGANDIGFATDVEFYTAKQIDELLEKSGGASLPILMPTWSDHLLNDVSWLRADTFSWQSGDVYKAAYEHLADDLESPVVTVLSMYDWYRYGDAAGTHYYTKSSEPLVGDKVYTLSDGKLTEYDVITSINPSDESGYAIRVGDSEILLYRWAFSSDVNITVQIDTIGDIKIEYYLAEDGHKICLPDQESNLIALYEATGVAWYFILDTENKQFKLPRTKYGFTGLRDGVGNYVAAGLPDHTHTITMNRTNKSGTDTGTVWSYNENKNGTGTVQSEGASNSIYGASDTVQPPATQMYLYFYVGNFGQSAIEQTAGLNAELFNGKADVSRVETLEGYDYVVESQLPTADNGYTWYRKYKSGWVEQGGVSALVKEATITLPVAMQDAQYTISLAGFAFGNTDPNIANIKDNSQTATGFVIQLKNYRNEAYGNKSYWYACGQAA